MPRETGRVLPVVERLTVRGGDFLGARPLLLGQHPFLHLQIRAGVVVVELGEEVGTAQAKARIDRRVARRTQARPTPRLVSGYRSGASTPEGVGPAR